MLIAFTYLPGFVTMVFRGMPTVWRGRHRLIFCWLIFMQAVSPGRKTLEEMARWTPAAITAWRFGRVLKAAYWNVHLLVSWLAQDLVATLPAPANGILYLFGDGSHADKRGTKNPVAQKGRISKHHPWFFGLRFVLLMAAWDSYRLPVGFRLILPKRHAGYRSENALFREMVGEFVSVSHLSHTRYPRHLRAFLDKRCNVEGKVLNRLIDLNVVLPGGCRSDPVVVFLQSAQQPHPRF
jgi:hypothetical protein